MRLILLVAAAVCLADAQKVPQLSIQNVQFSNLEDGPPVSRSEGFSAGETVYFSFQIAGYRRPAEEDGKINITYELEAKDPAGVPVIEPKSDKISTTLDPEEDKKWMPKARWAIPIPADAPPGMFRISVRVKDLLAKTEASGNFEFRVNAPDIPPSDALVIRNLAFYRAETDKNPVVTASYRPGDQVWIRFEMAGYKFGEKNRFDVGYGITVLRPDGQPSFSQPDAAEENAQSFYPRRYLPATFSLSLPKDVALGQYTVVISAHDKVGHQTAEARASFTVER